MHKHKQRQAADTWDEAECRAVIDQLWALRASLQAYESGLTPLLQGVDPGYEFSARNLAHYLALRHSDQRALQEWLTRVGLSSLGRAESHVMANLDKVLGILHRLTGSPGSPIQGTSPSASRAAASCWNGIPPTCWARPHRVGPCASW